MDTLLFHRDKDTSEADYINVNIMYIMYARDVSRAEYLIRKDTDNGFKANNEFYRIIVEPEDSIAQYNT